MKANRIEIILNSSQFDCEENRQQAFLWLHHMLPSILHERKLITERIFLRTMNQFSSFCVS